MPRKSQSQNWLESETAILIALYGENFSSLEKMAKKKPIFEKIAAKLREQGMEKTAEQVSKKISNLRSEYKKNHPGPTGGETPKWVHYEALHKILHQRPALNNDVEQTSEIGFNEPANLEINEDALEINGDASEVNENVPGEELNSTLGAETPHLKKKPRLSEEALKLYAETLELMKSQAEKREIERNEIRQTNLELIQVLGRIATSSEVMANTLTSGNIAILQTNNIL